MENKNWFIHVEWVVVLIALLGGFYLLDGKIERQGMRADRLYEIYCENQRDLALVREDMNKKWLDTQKEIKDIYINFSNKNLK